MKRTAKLLSVLLTFLLAVTVIGCIALAASSGSSVACEKRIAKAPEKEGYFLYYDYDAGASDKYSLKPNGEFASTVNSMTDGDVIKLLSDVTSVTESDVLLTPPGRGIYIDLNGYTLSLGTSSTSYDSHYLINPQAGCMLYVYSSDKTGKAAICTYSPSETEVLFNVSSNNIEIHMGSASAIPVLSYESIDNLETVSKSNAVCNGNGIDVFTKQLFSADCVAGAKFSVSGGNYYATGTAAFIRTACVETDISGATFISENGSIFSLDGIGAGLTVSDSLLYSCATVLEDVKATSDISIKFSDCYIYGSAILTEKSDNTLHPVFENCHMPSKSVYYNDGVNAAVKNNSVRSLILATASPVLTEGSVSSWNLYDLDAITVNFTAASASADRIVNVTWKTHDGEFSENWFKSAGVVPTNPAAQKANALYVYEYSPKITTTEKLGDSITYTLTPRINFTVRANLSLQAEFVYNLYIPTWVADSDSFRWARIDKKVDGDFEVESVVDFSNCAIKTIALSDTLTEKCYVISKSILANDGDNEYRLVLNLDGYYDRGEITHVQNFSIPDYVNRVNKGKFDEAAKNMVNAALTYIKAARNYESGEIGDALPYPITDFSAISGIAYQNKNSSKPSAEVSQAFESMNLLLGDKIMFSFLIESDYLNAGNTITFGYQVYGRGTETVVSKTQNAVKEGEYYRVDIPVYAVDLLKYVKIDLSSTGKGDDYRYGLLNYVNAIYNPDNESTLNILLDAIYAYGDAAYKYATTPDDGTPMIKFAVGAGTRIMTAETYAIIASGDAEIQAAEKLQAAIYAKTGELLEIASEKVSGKNSLKINPITKSASELPDELYSFKATVSGYDLVFDCSLKSYLDSAMSAFIEKHITPIENNKLFVEGFIEETYTDRVYYSDFGISGVNLDTLSSKYLDLSIWHGDNLSAIRSSLSNNFFEIKAAHDFINSRETSYTLCADDGAVYYISETVSGGTVQQISIKTAVDFGNAAFIIDDSDIPAFKTSANEGKYNQGLQHLFVIESPYAVTTITSGSYLKAIKDAGGINTDTKKIDLGLGYPAMIIPKDNTPANHKIYRRKGSTQYKGEVYEELLIIDKDGNIDSSTPVLFTYENLSSIRVYRTDIPEITVEGGVFYTVESDINCAIWDGGITVTKQNDSYIHRGIDVRRSNTVIKNVVHKVIGEFTPDEELPTNPGGPKLGAPYEAFFSTNCSTDVTFLGCTLEGRRNYRAYSINDKGAVVRTNASSYEARVLESNNVTFDSCVQSNFWIDADTGFEATESTTNFTTSMQLGTYWGSGGSNDCKNLTYINSTISRFDAHRGLYNGKIINSTVNGIELTGFGEMLIQDSTIYSHSATSALFALRNDYGNHWDGTVKIKNLDFYPYETEEYNYADGTATYDNGYEVYLVGHAYTNWYYCYKSQFPNVVIDGLEFYSRLSGRMITPDEMGPIKLVSDNASFMKQPDLHLEETRGLGNSYADAILSVVDNDGDGYIDGTEGLYNTIAHPSGKYYNNYYFDTDGDGQADQGTYTVKDPDKGIPIADFKGIVNEGMRIYSNKNLNPVSAPDKIVIKDSVGYDYASKYTEYFEKTTFLDDTLIYVEKQDANGNFISRDVIKGTYADDPDTVIPDIEAPDVDDPYVEVPDVDIPEVEHPSFEYPIPEEPNPEEPDDPNPDDYKDPPAEFTNPEDSPTVDYQ